MKESVATSWRMSSIGNSGARSSGPTGWSVPGCSGGGGGTGKSGITLYHRRGISDSSSVILVRSVTTASDLEGNIFSEQYSASPGGDPRNPRHWGDSMLARGDDPPEPPAPGGFHPPKPPMGGFHPP